MFRDMSGAIENKDPSVYSGINTNPDSGTVLRVMRATGLGNSIAKQLDLDKAEEARLRQYVRDLGNQMQKLEDEGTQVYTIRELIEADVIDRKTKKFK